jgi:hypothetical protein
VTIEAIPQQKVTELVREGSIPSLVQFIWEECDSAFEDGRLVGRREAFGLVPKP